MSHNQTKDISQEYVQHDNEAKTLYHLGLSIFVRAGFLAVENMTSDSIQIHKDGLASCFQNNKYPITNRIYQSMQYQGKGLGLHEHLASKMTNTPLQREYVKACSIKEKD